jgi:hypothetical protein
VKSGLLQPKNKNMLTHFTIGCCSSKYRFKIRIIDR